MFQSFKVLYALIILEVERYLVTIDTASLVDLIDCQLSTILYSRAVSASRTGDRSDTANFKYFAVSSLCALCVFCC